MTSPRQVDVTLEIAEGPPAEGPDRGADQRPAAAGGRERRAVHDRVSTKPSALVILVSLIGFWEWRSALLMALSIPLTLADDVRHDDVLGIDMQQVSIATLIIALGLLVDDPVVAGDAIKRELAAGKPRGIAAWLGPTKLATAILYATITNIVAYLPFLILIGTTGQFLYSLPVVMTCSLVASRIVSMTFIPLLGYYLLRGRARTAPSKSAAATASRRATIASGPVGHPPPLAGDGRSLRRPGARRIHWLRPQAAVLPEGLVAAGVHQCVPARGRAVRRQPGNGGPGRADRARKFRAAQKMPLEAVISFVGGGAPRFWYSLSPEAPHPNYAQIVLLFEDKHDTRSACPSIQDAAFARDRRRPDRCPPARNRGRRGSAGRDPHLRGRCRHCCEPPPSASRRSCAIFPSATRVRDNWGEDRFNVELEIDPDRANLVGHHQPRMSPTLRPRRISGYSRHHATRRRQADSRGGAGCAPTNAPAWMTSTTCMSIRARESRKVPLRQVSRVGLQLPRAR